MGRQRSGGEIWKILKKYQDGESGWLKSGKDDVPSRWEDWINYPLVWKGHELLGNCRVCPRTVELIRPNPRGQRCRLLIDEGGVKLDPHCDPLEDDYLLHVPPRSVCAPTGAFCTTRSSAPSREVIAFDSPAGALGRKQIFDRIILYIDGSYINDIEITRSTGPKTSRCRSSITEDRILALITIYLFVTIRSHEHHSMNENNKEFC